MRSTHFSVLAALGSAWILASYAAMGSAPVAVPGPARITVLYDAFGKDPRMTKDWGYAALVEISGKRILFDTGDDPRALAQNAKTKGVDLTRLDFVVLSHRHSDHVGGFSFLQSVNPKVKVYAPKENFGVFGSDLPGTFYRKDASLPAEMRYYGGTPPDTMKFGTVFPGANIQLIDKTTEVVPGITLIALISDVPGTKELKELSLAIDTPEGLLHKAFGDRYLYAGLGTSLRVDANPRAHTDARASSMLSDSDLKIYRTLLATSDDFEYGGSKGALLAQAQ
jgi:7,8-dihydropterin-6-yl-methyl-4-(beta-D-ribofuranosyl)aminobenzene 5'-phosphate synthase